MKIRSLESLYGEPGLPRQLIELNPAVERQLTLMKIPSIPARVAKFTTAESSALVDGNHGHPEGVHIAFGLHLIAGSKQERGETD